MRRKEMMISEAVFGKPPQKGWKSYALRLMLWVFGFLFLAVAGASVYLYYNQEEIKRLFIQEINRNLVTPVTVQDISLQAWKEFPMLSVAFSGVSANGADFQDEEELFHAQSISLSFNLRDIFRKRYIVREIIIRGGDFNLKHYGKGQYNYIIWKKRDTLAHPVSFHLNRVLLRNTLVRFRDLAARHDFQLLAKDVAAKGDLYQDGQNFYLKGELGVHSMKASGFVFLAKRNVFLDVRFSNEQPQKRFNVQKGRVKIENSSFFTNGYVCYDKKKPYMDFNFTGNGLQVDALLDLLPAASRAYVQDYVFKGRLKFDMNIRGDYTQTPLLVNASFDYADGQVRHKKSSLKASQLAFKGKFTNGNPGTPESFRLVFDTLRANLPTGLVAGRFSIQNFVSPHIVYRGELHAELSELQAFLNIMPAYRLQGKADSRLDFSHTFHALNPKEWKSADFMNARVNGYCSLKDLQLDFPDERRVESDSIYVEFGPKVAKTNLFNIQSDQTRIKLRLFVENLLPYLLLKGQNLYATAKLQSHDLDWEKLFPLFSGLNNGVKGKDSLPAEASSQGKSLLEDLYADVEVDIDRLYVPDVQISHLKGMLHYSWENISVENLSFDALQGSFWGSAAIGRQQEGYRINLHGHVQEMDISSCFKAFNNFGQSQFTYANIGGIFSADFRMRADYMQQKGIDPRSLQLWTQLNIDNGSLQNVESLRKISRFTGEDDLQDIHFANLHNVIEIENSTIRIAEMQVLSTSGNLSFSGTHTFANEVDYKVNIELSDLLSRRRAQRVKNQDEFGVVTGGASKINLPLHITGTLPDVEIKYDFAKARQGAKERLQENRGELREALREEYSDMRRKREDMRERKEMEKRQESGEFIIDLPEESLLEKPASTPAADTVQAKKKKKYKTEEDFRIEFEEE
ncbi:MAG: hypothetical protein J1F29_05460 [Lentimicrobiaceae bacterium]|nr:hypothetical protein [Lentimicrobiaceae bacterium]